jgi:hypothetical protein
MRAWGLTNSASVALGGALALAVIAEKGGAVLAFSWTSSGTSSGSGSQGGAQSPRPSKPSLASPRPPAATQIITTKDLLSLDSIRGSLGRQEETIIFALIERAAFRENKPIYTDKTLKLHKEGSDCLFDRDATFVEYMLCETEKVSLPTQLLLSNTEVIRS